MSALFTTGCYFLCMSSVGIMATSLAILVVLESRGFRNFHFSNNTFPVGTVIINLGNYKWGVLSIHKKCLTSMTILKEDDVIKKDT